MRVALVCGQLRPELDGVAGYTVRLARGLAARGLDTVIAAANEEAPRGWGADGLTGEARSADPYGVGVEVRALSGWDLPGVAAAGERLRDVDLVHVQFAPSSYGYRGAVGLLPAALGTTPLVTTLHEYAWWAWGPSALRAGPWPLAERLGVWDREAGLLTVRARAVVTTNAAHAAALRARLRRVRPTVIPIGANVAVVATPSARLRREVRGELGLQADAELIAFFGFVHPVKGIRQLVEALPLVRRARPRAALVLVGAVESLALRGDEAADYRAEVAARVAAAGVTDAVRLTGWLPDDAASRVLAAADLAALPFTAGTTTKSGALLTCAAHGLPIVATRADPPDPALVDGVAARLVGIRDPEGLAAGLVEVLVDPALRARLVAGAAGMSAGRGWDDVVDAHLALYAEVLR